MEIFVLNKELELVGILQNFQNLEWRRKLSEPGTFSVAFLYDDQTAKILTQGALLYNTEEPEPGIITRLQKECDTRGLETITAKGYMASRYLNQRIISNRTILTGTPSEIMRALAEQNAIAPSDDARRIPRLRLGIDASTAADKIEYQAEYTKLAKALSDIAESYELGYTIRLELAVKEMYFDIWSGTDRTITSARPCVFSPEFGSVFSQRYYEDDSNYASWILCGSGSDDDRITQSSGGGSGLERYEMYATASGISKKNQTEAQIKAQLSTAGAEKLAKYPKTAGFESKIDATKAMDFALGDYVTCENKRWGVREDMQIREIRRNISPTRDETTVTFGDPVPTMTGLLKAKE